MPFSHDVSSEIAFLIGKGTGGLQAWRAAMAAILADPRIAADMPMLWDFRRLNSLVAPKECPRLAGMLAALAPNHRVAVITKRPAVFGVARQLKALTHGQVMAFDTDVSSAIRWLRSHQEL